MQPIDNPETLTEDEGDDVWVQRWDGCDKCGCNWLVMNEEDPAGVPEPAEWDQFPECLVCGSSLTFGNADSTTYAQDEYERRRDLAVRFNTLVLQLQQTGEPRDAEIADLIIAAYRGPSSEQS